MFLHHRRTFDCTVSVLQQYVALTGTEYHERRDQVDSTRTVSQVIICLGTGRSSGCVVPRCLINYIPGEKTPGCFLFLRDAEVNGAFSQTPLPAGNWSNLKIISAVFVVSGAPAECGIIKYRKANFY